MTLIQPIDRLRTKIVLQQSLLAIVYGVNANDFLDDLKLDYDLPFAELDFQWFPQSKKSSIERFAKQGCLLIAKNIDFLSRIIDDVKTFDAWLGLLVNVYDFQLVGTIDECFEGEKYSSLQPFKEGDDFCSLGGGIYAVREEYKKSFLSQKLKQLFRRIDGYILQ